MKATTLLLVISKAVGDDSLSLLQVGVARSRLKANASSAGTDTASSGAGGGNAEKIAEKMARFSAALATARVARGNVSTIELEESDAESHEIMNDMLTDGGQRDGQEFHQAMQACVDAGHEDLQNCPSLWSSPATHALDRRIERDMHKADAKVHAKLENTTSLLQQRSEARAAKRARYQKLEGKYCIEGQDWMGRRDWWTNDEKLTLDECIDLCESWGYTYAARDYDYGPDDRRLCYIARSGYNKWPFPLKSGCGEEETDADGLSWGGPEHAVYQAPPKSVAKASTAIYAASYGHSCSFHGVQGCLTVGLGIGVKACAGVGNVKCYLANGASCGWNHIAWTSTGTVVGLEVGAGISYHWGHVDNCASLAGWAGIGTNYATHVVDTVEAVDADLTKEGHSVGKKVFGKADAAVQGALKGPEGSARNRAIQQMQNMLAVEAEPPTLKEAQDARAAAQVALDELVDGKVGRDLALETSGGIPVSWSKRTMALQEQIDTAKQTLNTARQAEAAAEARASAKQAKKVTKMLAKGVDPGDAVKAAQMAGEHGKWMKKAKVAMAVQGFLTPGFGPDFDMESLYTNPGECTGWGFWVSPSLDDKTSCSIRCAPTADWFEYPDLSKTGSAYTIGLEFTAGLSIAAGGCGYTWYLDYEGGNTKEESDRWDELACAKNPDHKAC